MRHPLSTHRAQHDALGSPRSRAPGRPLVAALALASALLPAPALLAAPGASAPKSERAVEPGAATPGPALTLAGALRAAREQSPALGALGHQVAADAARLRVDEEFANPELSVEVEDFLGSGVARRLDTSQVTVALSQKLPLGGKPSARERVKQARKTISVLERAAMSHQIEASVVLAYLDVLAQQRRFDNARDMAQLAEETETVVRFQVEAGRATPIEADKAAIARSLVLLSLEETRRALGVARQNLAAACGREAVFFGEVQGSLDRLAPPPAPKLLEGRSKSHPAVLVESARARHQQATLALEEANSVPDLTVSLGLRWIHQTRDRAVVAGLSLPLPLVNRRSGAIAAARQLELRAAKNLQQERVSRARGVANARQQLALASQRARVLRDDVYPKVEATYEAVREGYRLGRFGYLELLDSQAALFEIKERAMDAVVAYHRAYVALAREAALPMPTSLFEPVSRKERKR